MAKTTPKHILKLTREEKREFLESFDMIFSDCDGVLWTISQPIKGSGEAVNLLVKAGKEFKFVTNNSIRSEDDYQAIFQKIGVKTDVKELVHPIRSIVEYLRKIDFKGPIYFIGSTSSIKQLREEGYEVLDGPNELLEESFQIVAKHTFEQKSVKAVIMDIDFNLSAIKLMKADQYLKKDDCIFISGATDIKLPLGKYGEVIGPGAYLKLLEQTSGKIPRVLGKPGKELSELVLDKYSVKHPKRILFVGDMLEQDVKFGKMCGFQTLCVLTGGTNHERLMKTIDPDLVPDYYADCLGDFIELFTSIECKNSL